MKYVLLFWLVLFINPINGQEYIEVLKSNVNIRFGPSSTTTVVAQSDSGRIFELKEEVNGWCGILIGSGEYRYIHKSLCKGTEYTITMPTESQQKKLFHDLLNAEDRATLEADRKYSNPNDWRRNIEYQRILSDRYKLKAFVKHNLQPPIYYKIVGKGAKERWD